jgi:hypothetical protein
MLLFELAPGGVYLAAGHPAVARKLLPHDFTLACSSSQPPLAGWDSSVIGGVFSAALSLELPRVVVNDLPGPRSPDFPPAGEEPAGDPLSTFCIHNPSSKLPLCPF